MQFFFCFPPFFLVVSAQAVPEVTVHDEAPAAPAIVAPSAASPEEDVHVSGDVSDDEDDAALAAQREAERQQSLEAAGLLSKKPTRKRKPPAPPKAKKATQPSTEEELQNQSREVNVTLPTPTEDVVRENTEDAFDRWMALQRDLPPLPTTTTADDASTRRHSRISSTGESHLSASQLGDAHASPTPSPVSGKASSSTTTGAGASSGSGFFSRLLGSSTSSGSTGAESPAPASIVRVSAATPDGSDSAPLHVSALSYLFSCKHWLKSHNRAGRL